MENVARAVAERTAAAGLGVRVITSRLPRSAASREEGPARVIRCAAWEVGHTPVAPGAMAALLASPRPDVLHLHVAQPLAPEAALLVARLRDVPLVAHVHLDVARSGPLGVLLPAWKRFALGPVLRRADRVVVYGASYVDLVRARYGVAAERIEVIPGGVDLPGAGRVHRGGGARILFVGRLVPQKDVPLLVEAVARLASHGSHATLRIVGDGEDAARIRGRIRSLGLEGRVELVGRRDGAALAAELREAAVLALPSERESQGLVLLEAMAHGLPVVAADIPGVRDLVRQRETGLLAARDPDAFATALDEALRDVPLREALARAGLEVAAAHAWERIVPRWLALYERVVSERRAGAASGRG
jgi:glycosyltransferase involved in cell wall biosynthesis